MFDSNYVRKMKDIENLYPTMVATDMKMNHSRYVKKLYSPEDFTIKQILKLSSLINVDPFVITTIIIAEVSAKSKKRLR